MRGRRLVDLQGGCLSLVIDEEASLIRLLIICPDFVHVVVRLSFVVEKFAHDGTLR